MKSIIRVSPFFLLLFTLIGCGGKEKENHDGHTEKSNTFYTCSMDPQVKEDKPGKCPICHMDLTPIVSNDGNSNEINLSDQQIKLGNITMLSISSSQNDLVQNYNGVLAVNQDKVNTVSSRAMGRLEKLYFKSAGDRIKKNDPVYQLYSEEIAIIKKDYVAAHEQLTIAGNFGKNAQTMFNSAKQKLLFFGLTNEQIEALKTTKEVSPYTIFYSPYSGTISEIFSVEGQYVMEGTDLFKLVDLKSLWLETQVNVNYAKNLNVGQSAKVTFTDFPNKNIASKILFINPEIEKNSRLLLVRMEILNLNEELKPGMQAIIRLTESKVKGFFIPIDAVIREENATYIWIEKTHGVFENLMIETGVEVNGMIEVKSKLDAAKRVVITGAYAINSEYKFRKGSDPMAGMDM